MPRPIEIRCRALLFDMDGVLTDSTPAVARVWTAWALEHGFDPVEVVARAHGRPSLSTVREYLHAAADHHAANRELERREMGDLAGVLPLPGARELIDSIPLPRWALVTSATRALAEVRLRAAGLPLPPSMVTADDIRRGKPDPEPYRTAAALLRCPSSECVAFEDVPAGVLSARGSGARVIGVSTTCAPEELQAAGAACVVANLAEVSCALESEALVLRIAASG